jgi:hypothetical protein
MTGVGFLFLFLGSSFFFPAASSPRSAAQEVDSPDCANCANLAVDEELMWTVWSPDQYALADDGEAIWIGTSVGVIRWDKASGTYRRYTPHEGLLQQIYAVAVDGAGNRWFGGEGGLVKLDAAGVWSVYPEASGIWSDDLVDAIAVNRDGTLWVSHGLPDGPVSRLDPNGAWHHFPNRAAAVVLDYDRILSTMNRSRLWTAAGSEVWLGYWAYDGLEWMDRMPFGEEARVLGAKGLPEMGGPEPLATDVDSTGVLWAIGGPMALSVLRWQDDGWDFHSNVGSRFPYGGNLNTLAIGADDVVWLGYEGTWRSDNSSVGVAPLHSSLPPLGPDRFPGPVNAILPTDGGIWATGPPWLLLPDGQAIWLVDQIRVDKVTDILVTVPHGLWVHSHRDAAYPEGYLQRLEDRATTVLGDDYWEAIDASGPSAFDALLAWNRTHAGDLWISWTTWYYDFYSHLGRRHKDEWFYYRVPGYWDSKVTDFFVQDEQRVLMAVSLWNSGRPRERGGLLLDERGTIGDPSDDTWTLYPITTDGSGGSIAIDALGRMWFGDSSGLYRYDESAWQPVYQQKAVCELVPADDGTVFAGLEDSTGYCYGRRAEVLTIWPDGRQSIRSIPWVISEDFSLVQTAYARNRLWTVMPDGAVWYYDGDSSWYHNHVVRYHSAGRTEYDLPRDASPVTALEIDRSGHIWIVGNDRLCRLSARPTFSLAGGAGTWFVEPGGSGQRRMAVSSQGGYDEPITLRVEGLPAGISWTAQPNPVRAGEVTTITVRADPLIPLGPHRAAMIGTSVLLSDTVQLGIVVATEVYKYNLPLYYKTGMVGSFSR